MDVRLDVTAGPHAGKSFAFDRHDTFLVGRSKDAHFQLAHDDPYFSRRHFVVEVNPPRVRILDLKSRNGTHVNGQLVTAAELKNGDIIKAGHTILTLTVPEPGPNDIPTCVEANAGWLATQTHAGRQTVDSAPAVVPGESATMAAVPGYRLGSELGRGGMGVVYRAVRLSDNAPAAVKTIKPTAGSDRKAVERFVREARLLGKIRHPNVVGFLDAGEARDQLFIAMELVEGTDAGKLVKERGPLPIPAGVRVICQALAGLAAAHHNPRGIVHRDVKPANLLIGKGSDGKRVVKVADFGLARAYEESALSGLTLQGDIGGTPPFMAPEQVTHYRDAKPAADQYAAAATLYYLLTGHYTRDFPKNDVNAALIVLMTDKPISIRDRRAEIPDGLARVVHRALNQESNQRYADAMEFRAALAPFGTSG